MMRTFLRLFILSVLLIPGINKANACQDILSLTPYSAFRLILPEVQDYGYANPAGEKETTDYWLKATGGKCDAASIEAYFKGNADAANSFYKWLRDPAHKESYAYVKSCQEFEKLLGQYYSSVWDYNPASLDDLKRFAASVTVPAKGKLRARYLFLKLRALYAAADYAAAEQLWKTQCASLPASPLKERMEGYLAGVYYRTHRYEDAALIYRRLGDGNSFSWCLSQMVGMDNLRDIYNGNPQSPLVPYVLQDYVNALWNMQKANLGSYYDKYYIQTPYGFSNDLDLERGCSRLESLCREVLARGKSNCPLAWQTALAFVLNLQDKGAEAVKVLDGASLSGADAASLANYKRVLAWCLMKDGSEESSQRFIEAFESLMSDVDKELGALKEKYDYYDNDACPSFNFVVDVFLPSAMQYYRVNGEAYRAIELLAISNRLIDGDLGGSFLLTTSGDEMPIDNLYALDKVMHGNDKPAVDAMYLRYAAIPQDLVSDILGTRLLRSCRFGEALRYLTTVSPEFIKTQAVYPYLIRSISAVRPFASVPYRKLTDVVANPKAEYCRKVMELQARFAKAKGAEKIERGYELGNMLFQGSPAGYLWAMSDYYRTVTRLSNNLSDKAYDIMSNLWFSDDGTSRALKSKVAFALLSLPYRNELPLHWDWNSRTGKSVAVYRSDDFVQNEALDWLKSHYPADVPEMSSCDVLRNYCRR